MLILCEHGSWQFSCTMGLESTEAGSKTHGLLLPPPVGVSEHYLTCCSDTVAQLHAAHNKLCYHVETVCPC